jgi:hypothetical protein
MSYVPIFYFSCLICEEYQQCEVFIGTNFEECVKLYIFLFWHSNGTHKDFHS